jgi:hypothetical protein
MSDTMEVVTHIPDFLRANFDAARPAQHDDRRVGCVETGHGLAEEVEEPRRVDHVDLGTHPLGVAEA